jgi:hypothetical protein
MRQRLFVCSALVFVGLFGSAPTGSAQELIEVYPTGVAATDVANVQAAVNTVASPGTVVLKSADASGTPLAFNFGGTAPGTGGVISLLRPDITLTGDGWDEVLDEPKTKIVGGGGPFSFTPTVRGGSLVFAIRAPGVTLREIKLTTSVAYTGILIVSTTQWPANDRPVVIERNHIDALNYTVLGQFTASFPVRIDRNVLHSEYTVVGGLWTGLTLTSPGDHIAVPQDAAGNPVRHRFEVTRNRITTSSVAFWVYGWSNRYSQYADPDLACRRLGTAATGFTYQYAPGGNGPVLIAENEIAIDSDIEMMDLGGPGSGLVDAVFWKNVVSGRSLWGIWVSPWSRGNIIMDNDFLALQAYWPIESYGPSIIYNNVFGPQPPGTVDAVVALVSAHYQYTSAPAPHPFEGAVVAKNDYRATGVESGAILLATSTELGWGGPPIELKNNVVFESGAFPPGTGGAAEQVTVVDGLINPATGLPYVHDNRMVGEPASGLTEPGIGPVIARLDQLRKMLERR